MSNIRKEIALWVQAGLFIGLWLLLLYIAGETPGIGLAALARVPDVVLVYGVLHLVFTKWLWRRRVFSGWLVPFPDLQGTWKGTLSTTWIDPIRGAAPAPIPVVLAIRQTFSGITASIYTRESTSVSVAASLRIEEDSHEKWMSYLYTNTPRVSVRDRSVVHDGAAVLRVTTSEGLGLEGEYWTNRRSSGEMLLKRVSTDVTDSFID
jgi:hypothetical protein